MLIVFFSFTNSRFLTIENALIILQQAAPLGIAAIGMTFVLISAGIDISVGQNMYMSAIIVAITMEAMKPMGDFLGSPLSYMIIYSVAVLCGAAVGLINGILIARFKIVPFIATLATMGIARGVGLIASGSKVYFVERLSPISNGNIAGIPNLIIIFVILLITLIASR